jgi:hypothetical protein
MRATLAPLGAILFSLTLTAAAPAWFRCCPPPPVNAFTPSYCCPSWDGGYGSPYGDWPLPCQPFQGFGPPSAGSAGSGSGVQFFSRGPRDYFMVDP